MKQNVSGAPDIVIPSVFASSDKLLAIEFYDGIRFKDLTPDEQFEQKKKMIALFYKMVLT